jgi:diguanylate cyclase (GGDEF)-like protein/PAS domain S-box-containing protein
MSDSVREMAKAETGAPQKLRNPVRKGPERSVWLLGVLVALLTPAAVVSHSLSIEGTALWLPATGIGFTILVLYGPSMIPLLVGATTLAALVSGDPKVPLLVLVTTASANALALGLWAWAVRAAGIDLRLRTLRDTAVVTVAGAAATLASSVLTMVVLLSWHSTAIWVGGEHLLLSRAAGMFAVAPLLLLLAAGRARRLKRPKLFELFVLAMVFVVAADLSTGGRLGPPLYYPLLIPMVWAALRFGAIGTTLGAAVGTFSLAALEHRAGLPASQVMRVEIFMAVFSVAGLWFGAAQTERQDAQRELEASRAALAESEERLRLLIEGGECAIFMVDPHGDVLTWNSGAETLNGYRADEIIGRNISVLGPSADYELYEAARHGRAATETWRVRKDGSRYWANVSITAIRDDRGRLRGYSEVVLDLTERRAAEEQLKRQATHDRLTGLPNRSHLDDRLTQALGDGNVGLLFVDLDGFKQINDKWGHDTGDEVLSTIGSRLRSVVRPSDIAARVGGDEFVVVCTRMSNLGDLEAVAERVRAVVEEPMHLGGRYLRVGASIGLARAEPGQTSTDLLKQADRAMYAIKRTRPHRSPTGLAPVR